MVILIITPVFSFAANRVNADKIINKINRGENIYYKDTTIIGKFDFTKIKGTDREDINIHRSYVNSGITFINCVFEDNVIAYKKSGSDYYKVMFQRNVSFRGSTFKKIARFRATQFMGKAIFRDVVFKHNANFRSAQFVGNANFKNSKFNRNAIFNNVQFIGRVSFKDTTFRRNESFDNATKWGQSYSPGSSSYDFDSDDDEDYYDDDDDYYYDGEDDDDDDDDYYDDNDNNSSYSATINANDLIKDLNSGKNIYYENIIIEGDIDFTTVKNTRNYLSTIKQNLTFKKCLFKGRIIAYNKDRYSREEKVQFLKGISFQGSKIEGNVNFRKTTFNNTVDFSNVEFESNISFEEAEFEKTADFINVEFKRDANFHDVDFNGKVNFSNSEFLYEVNFSWSNFDEYADFSYTKFHREPNFSGKMFSIIKGYSFTGSTLNGRSYNP